MFAVVYSAPAMGPPIFEAIGEALPRMVHGGQEFVWGEPVCAGDTITTEASVKDIYEKDGKGFYVFESVSEEPGRRRGRARHLDQHRPRSVR